MGTGLQSRIAMRLRALRGALARRFLLKVKRATHLGPIRIVVPRADRVLVISPHMDDEVISCGGTLLLLGDQGAEIHVAYATDSSSALRDHGKAKAMSAKRRAEAKRVSEFMRFASTTELGFPDGKLCQNETALTEKLTELVRRHNPELILCPFPADAHADHMSCASALATAAVRAGSTASILAYEVWTPLWPNVAVDISEIAARKEQAIRIYESQVEDRDYASAALGLNRFRGMVHSVKHAEAFLEAEPAQFARLASLLDEV